MCTAKAIIVVEEGKRAAIQDVPVPKIRDEWILVRTKAVGLNPTDWKHVDMSYANAGTKLGCDYAGVVVEVGSKVAHFKEGDRVAGFCHGGHRLDHETGAFGEYVLAKANAQFLIPDDLSFEQAAVLPVALFTCGLGLYQSLGLPSPRNPAKEPVPILINGGSTGTGMLAIQFGKLSGLTVIATASPHNFDYLKSLGADFVFDYRSPTAGAEINNVTQNKLALAWDCSGGGPSLCAAALSSVEPSRYGTIANPDPGPLKTNPLVEGPLNVLTYDVIGEVYEFLGNMVRPSAEYADDAGTWRDLWEELLHKKAFKLTRVDVNRNGKGLEGVMKGLDELRQGNVSGTKLAYTL
ncbi:hypothetical protein S40293_10055 [Stachybotrys chartarum IBT 40293]|nr:hypothetical protein S40293_10055 [Stachybotrys chartarum IBT 40293]